MGHHHSHQLSGKRLLFSIVLNIVITISQIIGGVISGSLALISDAVHNLSDVISLIISYVANLLTNLQRLVVFQYPEPLNSPLNSNFKAGVYFWYCEEVYLVVDPVHHWVHQSCLF